MTISFPSLSSGAFDLSATLDVIPGKTVSDTLWNVDRATEAEDMLFDSQSKQTECSVYSGSEAQVLFYSQWLG